MSTAVRSHGKAGIVLHSPVLYDLIVGLATAGREKALRDAMLRLARIRPGESVLDAGCGTGTLAIAARHLAGSSGKVCGVDPSPEMLARARRKAHRAGAEIEFRQGTAQAIPFPDASFDVITATFMLHHLPRSERPQFFREIRRVLKPGGRLFLADFTKPAHRQRRLIDRLHRPHGHVDLADTASMLKEAGLEVVANGAMGMKDLHYILASVAGDGSATRGEVPLRPAPSVRSAWPWLLVTGLVLVLAAHLTLAGTILSHGYISGTVAAGLVVLILLKHLGFAAPLVAFLRRRHFKEGD